MALAQRERRGGKSPAPSNRQAVRLLPLRGGHLDAAQDEIDNAGHDDRDGETDVGTKVLAAKRDGERTLVVDHGRLVDAERGGSQADDHRNHRGPTRWKLAPVLVIVDGIVAPAQEMLDD